jgi:hypothetical protein
MFSFGGFSGVLERKLTVSLSSSYFQPSLQDRTAIGIKKEKKNAFVLKKLHWYDIVV